MKYVIFFVFSVYCAFFSHLQTRPLQSGLTMPAIILFRFCFWRFDLTHNSGANSLRTGCSLELVFNLKLLECVALPVHANICLICIISIYISVCVCISYVHITIFVFCVCLCVLWRILDVLLRDSDAEQTTLRYGQRPNLDDRWSVKEPQGLIEN